MKKKRKIGGIWYTLDAFINADSTVTVAIKSEYSNSPVLAQTYSKSAEGAMAQAWHDWAKVRAQIMADKV